MLSAIRADIPIADVQMARLIFFVTRAGIIDVGQAIKGEHIIALESVGLVDNDHIAMEILVLLIAGSNAKWVRLPGIPDENSGLPKALLLSSSTRFCRGTY